MEESTAPEGFERDAAAGGARRALACAAHELASPLTALATYLRMAKRAPADAGAAIDKAIECVTRLREINEAARAAGGLESLAGEVALADAAMAASARTGRVVPIDGDARAAVGAEAAALALAGMLDAAGRAALDGAEVRIVIAAGPRPTARVLAAPPGAWRAIDPLSAARVPLGVWIAALIARATGGALRIGEVGLAAIELELPGGP